MTTMSVLAPLLTGLGLFFCGVRFIAANLTPLVGPAARRLFRKAVATSWSAGAVGVIAGLATQSTNAVSLIVVGFVRAGVIPETRAALLPAWSHVGAAALVILVSLQTNVAVAYALALAGAALYFDFNLSDRLRHGVFVLMGAGMLLLGMEMLKVASDPLRAWLLDRGLLVHGGAPAAPLLIGLGLAAVTQSSTVAGAIAVALVRVGVFDFGAALVLLVGASAGSAVNYVILGRKGEAVGRHVLLFQAAQKLFGGGLLGAVLLASGGRVEALLGPLRVGAAMGFAWMFLATQVAGSLACTLMQAPLSRLLQRMAPPGASESLARPAFLLDEALADPFLALDLVEREELRLLQRLAPMLDAIRDEGAADGPSAETLRAATAAVCDAIRRYLAAVLEGEPGRHAVARAMRLQRVLDNLVALAAAVAEFVGVAGSAAASEGARTVGHMVESLHMLLEVLAEIAAAGDAGEGSLSLALMGDREKVVEGLRTRLMQGSADAPAKVQQALFRSTVLFERILWLARDTAVAILKQGEGGSALPAPEKAVFTPAEA